MNSKIANNMPLSDNRLRLNVIEMIKSDNVIKNKLAITLDKSYPTIQRYLNNNDVMLTTAAALEVLRDSLKLSDEDILNK